MAKVPPSVADPEPNRSSDDTTLVDRVRKLLAKAEATPNPHEADAFSRKAAELIAQHRIDPERLAADAADALGVLDVALGRGAYVRARLALLTAVAAAHDGYVLFGATPSGTVASVAGFRSDLTVIEMMYHSLHAQAATQMAAIRRPTGPATQRFRRSFLFGYAARIDEILIDARNASTTSAAGSGSAQSSVELALQERAVRVEEFARSRYARVRTARQPGRPGVEGYVAGLEAAGQADIGRARLAGRPAIGRGE